MSAEDDRKFAEAILGGLQARLLKASDTLRASAQNLEEVQFKASLRAAIAKNDITLRVARLAKDEELIERLSMERTLLDAAADSAENN